MIMAGVVFLMLFVPAAVSGAADFSYPDLDGKIHRLSDYRGKWVVVNYWATWCPPCLEELPELEVFHDGHKDRDALVLGLNMENIRVEKLRTFVEEQFLSYPVLRVGSRPGLPLGRVPGLPTTFLVSPEGDVVARMVGPIDGKIVEAFISNYKK
ncbi:MAG TPA: TlpA family protein disulfide reductase [Chromatiaceae bacterium]|nr:TlpA family protein disulfide reductase [Chromatiaceae bacterium]